MPLLNWSPVHWRPFGIKGQREAMTRLFDAYFRVAGEVTGTILHLDLRTRWQMLESRRNVLYPFNTTS